LHQPILNRVHRRFGARGNADLGEDVSQVNLDRVLGDEQLLRDFLVARAGRHQSQDFALAFAQIVM